MYTLRTVEHGAQGAQSNYLLGDSYSIIDNKKSSAFKEFVEENKGTFIALGDENVMGVIQASNGVKLFMLKGNTYYFMLEGKTIGTLRFDAEPYEKLENVNYFRESAYWIKTFHDVIGLKFEVFSIDGDYFINLAHFSKVFGEKYLFRKSEIFYSRTEIPMNAFVSIETMVERIKVDLSQSDLKALTDYFEVKGMLNITGFNIGQCFTRLYSENTQKYIKIINLSKNSIWCEVITVYKNGFTSISKDNSFSKTAFENHNLTEISQDFYEGVKMSYENSTANATGEYDISIDVGDCFMGYDEVFKVIDILKTNTIITERIFISSDGDHTLVNEHQIYRKNIRNLKRISPTVFDTLKNEYIKKKFVTPIKLKSVLSADGTVKFNNSGWVTAFQHPAKKSLSINWVNELPVPSESEPNTIYILSPEKDSNGRYKPNAKAVVYVTDKNGFAFPIN